MKTPTYKEQFDKLTTAYIKDEVHPYDCCACFVGNLLNKHQSWAKGRGPIFGTLSAFDYSKEEAIGCIKKEAGGLYSLQEIVDLEKHFMDKIEYSPRDPKWEEGLFNAFSSTLDLLKEIHLSKGEVIDDTPLFVKRKLQTI